MGSQPPVREDALQARLTTSGPPAKHGGICVCADKEEQLISTVSACCRGRARLSCSWFSCCALLRLLQDAALGLGNLSCQRQQNLGADGENQIAEYMGYLEC